MDLDREIGQRSGHHIFIFFLFERTGGVDESAAGGEVGVRLAEDGDLALLLAEDVIGGEPPADFRIAAKSAGAGAGNIGEDAVKALAEGQRLRGVQMHQRYGEVTEAQEAFEAAVAGDGANSGGDGHAGLIAGRGAKVQERLPRLGVEQGNDGAGTFVHAAVVFFGGLEKGLGDTSRRGFTVAGEPTVNEPIREREFGGEVGESNFAAVNAAEDGVHQRGGFAVIGFDKLDGFHDGGVRRDAREVAELVDAHAKDEERGVVQDEIAAAGEVLDEGIELCLVAQDTIDDVVGKAGVAGIERAGKIDEGDVGEGASFNAAEGFKGDAAGGGDRRSGWGHPSLRLAVVGAYDECRDESTPIVSIAFDAVRAAGAGVRLSY